MAISPLTRQAKQNSKAIKIMIGIAELKALNNRPPKIKDNFNRDSSCVQSALGYVIHSGVHRSTAFISKADHPDSWFAFSYWRTQGQAAINGFIELIIDGAALETAEAEAFRRSRPDWHVSRVAGTGKLGGCELVATRASGRLTQRASAYTWRHLHARTA